MPRRCTRVTLPNGAVALVTHEVPNPKPCAFCRELTDQLCDFPLRGKKLGRTCSKRTCKRCSTPLGPELDLCPPHAKVIADHQLEPRLRPLLADDNKHGHAVALDMIEQVAGIVLPPAFRPQKQYELDRDLGGVLGLADWTEFFNERAAIFEYEGGFSREIAERKAHALAGERPRR